MWNWERLGKCLQKTGASRDEDEDWFFIYLRPTWLHCVSLFCWNHSFFFEVVMLIIWWNRFTSRYSHLIFISRVQISCRCSLHNTPRLILNFIAAVRPFRWLRQLRCVIKRKTCFCFIILAVRHVHLSILASTHSSLAKQGDWREDVRFCSQVPFVFVLTLAGTSLYLASTLQHDKVVCCKNGSE